MKNLEAKFNKNLEEGRKHCVESINSSNPKDYLNCEAYKNIVAMGKETLPLIRKVYDTESSIENSSLKWLLSSLVIKIVGDEFKIPEQMRGKVTATEKYTVKWLDENMNKYIQR